MHHFLSPKKPDQETQTKKPLSEKVKRRGRSTATKEMTESKPVPKKDQKKRGRKKKDSMVEERVVVSETAGGPKRVPPALQCDH